MHYEVELKFPVADMAALELQLAQWGVTVAGPVAECDWYFAHPARDFAATDEALRLRRRGEANYITYKGPKVDTRTKTRHELELPLGAPAEAIPAWTELLQALGFHPLAEVCKSRRKATIDWRQRQIEASLDEVRDVGTFVELELLADEQALAPAQAAILSLAQALGLSGSEHRSYLEMVLEKTLSQSDRLELGRDREGTHY